MSATPGALQGSIGRPRRSLARLAARVALHAVSLLTGIAAFVAHEHFALQGASTASTAALVGAAVFGLAPVRLLLHELAAIEGKAAHLVHGLGGLSLIGLTLGGAIPSGTMLDRAALAPFAMMGAAQALMHSTQPRDAQQAAAMRQFVASLPEVEQLTRAGALSSPGNARRAAAVLTDIVSKAETLGETELHGDPQFQSAWKQATTRVGLSLGLDAVDHAVDTLAANPATAGAVPELRLRVAAARRNLGS
jgi:hypothetical protein